MTSDDPSAGSSGLDNNSSNADAISPSSATPAAAATFNNTTPTTTASDNNNGVDDDDYESMSIKDLRRLLTVERGYDCSQCLEKSDLIAAARKLDAVNYDDEAHALFRELNLHPAAATTRPRYSTLDAIWKHQINGSDRNGGGGGGTVYVGNYVAASNWRTLQERNIVAVVNCQDETSENYFEKEPNMHYHRFVISRLAVTISYHRRNNNNNNHNSDSTTPYPALQGGFQQAFDFVQQHIEQGNSVLIHCLAGAHRAGTLGTAWIMYQTGKTVDEALYMAKTCRPVINPFGTLLELLHRLQTELEERRKREK